MIVGRDRARAETAIQRRPPGRGDLTFEHCDVTSRQESLRSLVARVLASHGRIDVLINGAGVNSATPFLEITDEEIERMVAVDQLAVMRACQAFGRYFVQRPARREGASIINVGSRAAHRCHRSSPIPCQGRGSQPDEEPGERMGPPGIRCNVLVPGFFPAEQNRAILTPSASRTHHRADAAAATRRAPTSWRAPRRLSRAMRGGSSPAPRSSSTAASAHDHLRATTWPRDSCATTSCSPARRGAAVPRGRRHAADRRSAQPSFSGGYRRRSRLRDAHRPLARRRPLQVAGHAPRRGR